MCNTDIELVTFSREIHRDHNEKLFSETILTETIVDSDKWVGINFSELIKTFSIVTTATLQQGVSYSLKKVQLTVKMWATCLEL